VRRRRFGARGKHIKDLCVELCLANIAALSARVLPPLLQAFRAAYPHVGLSVVEMERDEQENALCEQRIHVGIYPGDPPAASHFQSQALFSCPMVVVVPPGHELAKEDHLEVDVLRFADEKLRSGNPSGSARRCPCQDASPGCARALF
jgi:DNA-binding transcriptional LysR family regulator